MTFKEVWKKAIEKYSPKKAERLNEVSQRFELKLEEVRNQNAKNNMNERSSTVDENEGKSRLKMRGEDGDAIKFVSMIDQKPIKPSYLELIPLKNFAKKEQVAQREQFKESQKAETNDSNKVLLANINYKNLLEKDMKEKMLILQQEMDEIKNKNQNDLKQGIKQELKKFINDNGGAHPNPEEM